MSVVLPLVAALATGVGITAYRYAEVWTPLQRQYLGSYLRSAVAWTTRGPYELWQRVDRTGRRLALDEDLVTVTSATGDVSFALSAAAVTAGATALVWQRQSYPHAALHAFLSHWVYHDQTLFDLAQPALWGALALFFGGLIGARAQHAVDARAWRARYPAREADDTRAPVILDYGPSPSRSPAPPQTSSRRPSNAKQLPLPARPPASAPPAIAAGEVVRPRGKPPTSPASWPDPFFK